MTRWHIGRPAMRSGLASGLPAAALAWLLFLAVGGSHGMARMGTVLPMAVFVIEAILYGYAGFRLRRSGYDTGTAMLGGIVAGWTTALLAAFPRNALLMLSVGYMRFLQAAPHLGAGSPHMPWPPLTVLLALVGALLAGSALGAACGSIGASLARADAAAPPTQLP